MQNDTEQAISPEPQRSSLASILIADDEQGLRDMLQWELQQAGYRVTAVSNGKEAIDRLHSDEFDLVLSDIRMPEANGVEVLKKVKELGLATVVIIATGYAETSYAVECVRSGAFDFPQKPFEIKDLLQTVERGLEHARTNDVTVLSQASRLLMSSRSHEALLSNIVSTAREMLCADEVWLLQKDHRSGVKIIHSELNVGRDEIERSELLNRSLTTLVSSYEQPVLFTGDKLHFLFSTSPLASDPDLLEAMRHYGNGTAILLPLVAGTWRAGCLHIRRSSNSRGFQKPDVERAVVLGAQIALALDNERLINQAVANDRLASLGQLAAGLAHEIKSPLTYIQANVDFIKENLEQQTSVDEHVDASATRDECIAAATDAREGVERIRHLIADLRGFSRPDENQLSPTDINEVIKSALRVTKAELQAYVADVAVDLGEGVDVLAAPSRLSQIFINLLVNASHALRSSKAEHKKVGVVMRSAIKVSSRRYDDHVTVTIADNGQGIPSDVLPFVFEPFFTTKDAANGTGLGLSISRDIARSHGGDLKVESAPGQGATFTLTLPALSPSTQSF